MVVFVDMLVAANFSIIEKRVAFQNGDASRITMRYALCSSWKNFHLSMENMILGKFWMHISSGGKNVLMDIPSVSSGNSYIFKKVLLVKDAFRPPIRNRL